MLTTIWLILGALSFAPIMEEAGFLDRLIVPIVARAKSTGGLIAAVIGTASASTSSRATSTWPIVMPSRVYRAEFAKRGLAPRMLSRAVEDSGTVTSPLVPWNSCGAYMAGVLGVATIAYLPFCFFNLASPVISLFYGFTGFPRGSRASSPPGRATGTVTETPTDERSAHGGTSRARPSRSRRRRRTSGFALPSAYTILFVLIVLIAIATYLIPAGVYDLDADGAADPGDLPPGRAEPAADRRRLADGARSTASTASRPRTAASASGTPASCSARSTSRSSSSSSAASSA